MIVKNSSLKIVTLDIIKFNYSFGYSSQEMEGKKVEDILPSYVVDMDYNIFSLENEYNIILKFFINQSGTLPGYKIELSCGSIFELQEKLPKEAAALFIRDSALPIAISFVRTFLMTATSSFPFGRYTLPAIDMYDLKLRKEKEKESKSKRKPAARKATPKQ